MNGFILPAMIFCHIFDDFFLQSAFLANGKQRSWWKKNAPDRKYRYDYVPCLLAHAFSWTFMMMLPVALAYSFQVGEKFFAVFIINFLVHAFVDDQKANQGSINLIVDQSIHILQICITFIFMYFGR